METRIIVSAVIARADSFLFGRKPAGIGPYPDSWHLLGGGINPGESIIDALNREVFEEGNITLADIEPLSFDEDYEKNKHGVMTHYIFLTFKAKYKSGELKAKDDITQLEWFDKSSLSNIELNRPSIKLFKKFELI